MRADFLMTLQERGFIHQVTDSEGLNQALKQESVTGYVGFDMTATSLHVGNLVGIMLLRWLQKAGHRPLILLGGGTTYIGDPSGKDRSRQLLTAESIQKNTDSIRKVFAHFIDVSQALILDNSTWLLSLNYIEFLRDYGCHFSVNRMLGFDSVKLRLEREQSLSFLEFNYMILQAYDFYYLHKTYGCCLQMGGSDQWGNIINGVELVRKVSHSEVFGLTAPLITNSDGSKMGKSVKGAVWLDADVLSPYDYWQFWRNTQDSDVGRYLRLFTEISLDEIRRLEALQDAEINEAKKILADAATELAHGSENLGVIHGTIDQLFGQDQGGDFGSLPRIHLSDDGSLAAALVSAGLASSKGEARRLIRGQGIKVNDVLIIDELYMLQSSDFFYDGWAKLSVGKKRHVLVSGV